MAKTRTRKSLWDSVLLALLFGSGQALLAMYLQEMTDNDMELAAVALITTALGLFVVRLWQAGKFPGREKFYPVVMYPAFAVASSWHIDSVVSESSERGRMSLLHFGAAVLFLWAVNTAFDKQLFAATRIASYSLWLALFVNVMSQVFILSGRIFSDTLYLVNIASAGVMTLLLTYVYHTQKQGKEIHTNENADVNVRKKS